MQRVCLFFRSALLGFAILSAAPIAARAAGEPLEAWMPDDIIGFAKLSGTGKRLEDFLKSDLRRELEALEPVRDALAQPKWKKFLQVVEAFKTSTGKEPVQLFQDLLGNEVLVGARLGFGGPEIIVLSRTKGAAKLEEGIKTLKSAIEQNGIFPQYEESMRGDTKIEAFQDKFAHAVIGDVWVLSNVKGAVERVIDLASGKSSASLKKAAAFAKASDGHPKDSILSLAVRPQFIPNYSIPEKVENALGSLIVGGWLAALDASDLLTASLRVADGNLDLKLASILGERAKDEKLQQKYAGFFPDVVPDVVRQRLEKRGILAVAELQRNLAQWWEKREELLTSKAAGDLIEFSNVMNIVFGPRSFQDEVLPDLGPTIAIVSRNQEYKGLSGTPQPAIPGFAAIFQLKNVEESRDSMAAAFNSIVSIINLDRAQKKTMDGMSMLAKIENVGEVEMHTVAFNTRSKAKDQKPGLLHNFTPSLAVVGSRVVLSSSAELTRILIEELSSVPESKTGAGKAPDTIAIDGPAVRSILEANKEVYVADQMVKKGISKPQAEEELKLLQSVLQQLRDLRIQSSRQDGAMSLDLKLRTSLGAATAEKSPVKVKADAKSDAKSEPKKAVKL